MIHCIKGEGIGRIFGVCGVRVLKGVSNKQYIINNILVDLKLTFTVQEMMEFKPKSPSIPKSKLERKMELQKYLHWRLLQGRVNIFSHDKV